MSDRIKLRDTNQLLTSALNPATNERAVRLLTTDFLLLPSVHFIAAVTKHGKTNFAANLVCTTLDSIPDKKIFVGLNEETAEDFIIRCGCILTGLSFAAWKGGKFTADQKISLTKTLPEIVSRMSFVDESSCNMGCIEDVDAVVRSAASSSELCLIVFDYLQNVYLSKINAAQTQYELSKRLGTKFKDIAKTTLSPIVVFGQLKDGADLGFKSRVEGDSWFVNNVSTGIELVADKMTRQSKLIIQVDRFQSKTHNEYHFNHTPSGRLTQIASPEAVEEL